MMPDSRKAVLVASLIVATGLLVAPSVASRVIDRVAAVVNDGVILTSEVDRRCQVALSEVPATLPLKEVVERKRKIRMETLDALIDDLLLKQQVNSHKIRVEAADVKREIDALKKSNNLTDAQFSEALRMEGKTMADLQKEFELQLERRRLIESQMRNNPEMRSQMQVGEKDIEEYYRTHYSKTIKVRARHILLAAPPGTKLVDLEKTRARAEAVLKQLRAGAAFEEMAKQHSDDPSGSLGGDLGWFRRGDMVASFEKVAFGLQKGQTSDLVRTQFGFHLIQVTDRAHEDPQSIQEVRGRVQQMLYGQKYQRAVRTWLAELRRQAFIDIKL